MWKCTQLIQYIDPPIISDRINILLDVQYTMSISPGEKGIAIMINFSTRNDRSTVGLEMIHLTDLRPRNTLFLSFGCLPWILSALNDIRCSPELFRTTAQKLCWVYGFGMTVFVLQSATHLFNCHRRASKRPTQKLAWSRVYWKEKDVVGFKSGKWEGERVENTMRAVLLNTQFLCLSTLWWPKLNKPIKIPM